MAEILIRSDHACRSEENRFPLTPSRRWLIPYDSGTSIVNTGAMSSTRSGPPSFPRIRTCRRYGVPFADLCQEAENLQAQKTAEVNRVLTQTLKSKLPER